MLGCLLLVSFLILSKQAAEVSETMSSTENSKIILVDAGHGGADPGMIGVNGLEEKGINLQIAEITCQIPLFSNPSFHAETPARSYLDTSFTFSATD